MIQSFFLLLSKFFDKLTFALNCRRLKAVAIEIALT